MSKVNKSKSDGSKDKKNGKYLMVRLNDEQYALLNEYREQTGFGQSLYLRKLIDGERITVSCHKSGVKPFAAFNRLHNNISQICRSPLVQKLGGDYLQMLEFLSRKLDEEIVDIVITKKRNTAKK